MKDCIVCNSMCISSKSKQEYSHGPECTTYRKLTMGHGSKSDLTPSNYEREIEGYTKRY